MNRELARRLLLSAWPFALLALLVFGVYSVVLWSPLIFDDHGYILKNPLVTGTWRGWGDIFLSSFASTREYEPLVILLHRALHRAVEDQPLWYRLSSIALHWGFSGALFVLYRRVLKSDALALAGAALFALYPAHAVVVAQSVSKKHILVALFGAAMLLLEPLRDRPRARVAGCWGLMGLALLCKETALVLPVILLLAARARPRPGSLRGDWKLYGGLAVLAAGYLVFRAVWVPRDYPSWTVWLGAGNLVTAGKCLLWYLSQLPVPWDLCLEHSLSPVDRAGPASLGIVLGLAVLGWGAVWVWRRDRVLGLGLAWTLLGILPFLGIVAYRHYSLVADRYLYLASAGFFLLAARCIGLWLSGLRKKPSAKALLAGVSPAVLAYGALAVHHAVPFSDPVELWSRAAECAPENPRVYASLGEHYFSVRDYAKAMENWRKTEELAPEHVIDFFEPGLACPQRPGFIIGLIFLQTGNTPEALREFTAALGADIPADSKASIRDKMGDAHMARGRVSEALREYAEAGALSPGWFKPHWKVGMVLQRGDPAKAIEMLERAEAKVGPHAADRRKILSEINHAAAKSYLVLGRREEAARAWEAADDFVPDRFEVLLPLADNYWRLGRGRDALKTYARASRSLERTLLRLRAEAAVSKKGDASALIGQLEGLKASADRMVRRLGWGSEGVKGAGAASGADGTGGH